MDVQASGQEIDDAQYALMSNIKAARKELHMNQEQFGSLLGIVRRSVWNVESGYRDVSLQRVGTYAARLGVELSALLSPGCSNFTATPDATGDPELVKRVSMSVRLARTYMDLPQKQLAHLSGVSHGWVRLMDLHKVDPSMEQLRRITTAMGLRIRDLVADSTLSGLVLDQEPRTVESVETYVNNFTNNVSEYCRIFDVTQQELARRSGVSQSLVSLIQCGDAMPVLENVVRIASALGVEDDVLFRPPGTMVWSDGPDNRSVRRVHLTMSRIGKVLKVARVYRGLTAKDIKATAGVAAGTITAIESGKPIRLGLLSRISAAMNIPFPDLLSPSALAGPMFQRLMANEAVPTSATSS